MIDLIYTSGNNATYARMTQEARWLVGMRSDRTPCDVPIQFVDIDYKAPNFARHLDTVKRFRPRYAVVPDLSETEVSQSDVDRALRQVDQLSAYCETVFVIPKLAAQLAKLPPHVAIGFSVVSDYGGVRSVELEILPLLEGRRIHLLGGSPHKQMELYRYISCYATVVSADGNMFQYLSGRGKYWCCGKWVKHPSAGQMPRDPRVTPDCVAWSLNNIRHAWFKAVGVCPICAEIPGQTSCCVGCRA